MLCVRALSRDNTVVCHKDVASDTCAALDAFAERGDGSVRADEGGEMDAFALKEEMDAFAAKEGARQL